MNENIENQLERLGIIHQQTKCPKTQKEIDQAVENAITSNRKSFRKGWLWAAAAAVVIAVAVPTAIAMENDSVKTIKVGNAKAYFCCNNDCDAESTIELFNSLIH